MTQLIMFHTAITLGNGEVGLEAVTNERTGNKGIAMFKIDKRPLGSEWSLDEANTPLCAINFTNVSAIDNLISVLNDLKSWVAEQNESLS